MTGINVAVLHADADSWLAKFSCNLSSLNQLRSMVILKKKLKNKNDSPAAYFDSYVIIKKNDYESNNAYVLKLPLDMRIGGWGVKLLPTRYRASHPCGFNCTLQNTGHFSN